MTTLSKTISTVTTTINLEEIDGSLGTTQLQSIRNSKETQLIFMPIPNTDSNKAIGFDLYGVKREINFNGLVTGTTTELQAFFVAMEGMNNGSQWETDNKSLQLAFDFDTTISYNVLIKSFSWNWDKGAPNKLTYTLVLAEIDPNQGSS